MGKASTPAAPDYTKLAKEQATSNMSQMQAQTTANRPNQYTPFGSIEWSRGAPTQVFNQSRYDEAIKAAQGSPSRMVGSGEEGFSWEGGQPATSVDRNDPRFYDTQESNDWTQTTKLDPRVQAQYDQLLANPGIDESLLPKRAINAGQTAQEAILSRLSPQLAQQDEALRTRLANQGINLGTEAYSREMALQGQRANDLQLQAALQGINIDQAARSGALQEQAFMQNQPLNVLSAIRSGSQVQAPGFSTQGYAPGADITGAADKQYQAQIEQVNAQNASSPIGGLFSLGMGLAGLPGAGGSIFKGVKGLFS